MADVELLPLPQPVVWITDESVDAIKSVHVKDSPYGIHGLTCKYAKCVNPLYSAETVDALQAENERLAEALKEIRSRSSIDLAMRSDQFELTARLGDIYQIADAALEQEAGRG